MLSLIFILGCSDFRDEFRDDIGPSSLSGKRSILKVSYTEAAQRKAAFDEGTPEGHSLTYMEEPRSERKQVYVEIYHDLTYSKQIIYLEPQSDFPADRHVLPDDMPEMKKVIYSDGFARGYDKAGKLILEEPFEDRYWIDPSVFVSIEDAGEYVINTYFDPEAIAEETLEYVRRYSDRFERLGDGSCMAVSQLEPSSFQQEASARTGEAADEVVEEKTYFMPRYGVLYRTEGYTADGTLKDIEHNFYEFTTEGAFVMTSSHYRNRRYSAAYDLSFVEHSDIFFENYKIQANKN
ncbi:MAG: hypothetical protein GDA51_01520 [Ekhidna sp.]|nr:hypothetical protein [Ekhidna sp.]